jgi:sigma-B regulation protein RsbU (phosphoserine phosphatase)
LATTRDRKRIGDTPPLGVAFRILYFAFVLAIVILEFPGVSELTRSPDPGIHTRNLVVQGVREDGPNRQKNLQPGDEIYAVAGERIRNYYHYRSVLTANESYAPLEYDLLRDGAHVAVVVEFDRVPQRQLVQNLAVLLVALSFLLLGTWVYLRRPDLLGSLFAINCAMLAFLFTHRPSVSNPALQLAAELVYDATMLAFPAFFLHFFLVFPGRPQRSTRSERRWRLIALYAVPAALYAVTAAVIVSRFGLRPVEPGLVAVIMTASTLYVPAYLIASLVLFVRAYRSSPRARKQKLRVVTVGTLIGILPFVVTLVFRQVAPGENFVGEFAAVLCVGFVPATFAYAILKHGAIELIHVVRRGLVYAVLTGAIIAVYYIVVAVVGDFVMRELNVAHYVFMPVAVLVLAIAFAPARAGVQRLVDRLFYRGEYAYRQEVFEFNRQLARKLHAGEIYDSFVVRVNGLLNSSWIAIYTREKGRELSLYRSVGDPPELPENFSLQSFLGRYFSRYMTPLQVEFLEPTWEHRRLDGESKLYLGLEGLAVCIPVVAHDRFISLILLGEKRSGLVYTRTDAELLATFSEQLALVLQNAELLQASIEQERLQNEVMLARDIQLSLVPPAPPDHPKIEIFGQMISSFEVGGDYFDYFFIDEDRIALAVGDVSGKGIPAAMLMSSLQAVFKNLAIKDGLAPADLNKELNAHLVGNAKPEQFASFFYGVMDLRQNRFNFSNAGHCPGLLVKETYADRLGQGGLVLGVQVDADYRQGSVMMEPGDLLALYTDGISEQKNPEGEEYGEDRLISFLVANKKLPIRELQSALFQDVLEFGGGQQQDDTTCVFACYKSNY